MQLVPLITPVFELLQSIC